MFLSIGRLILTLQLYATRRNFKRSVVFPFLIFKPELEFLFINTRTHLNITVLLWPLALPQKIRSHLRFRPGKLFSGFSLCVYIQPEITHTLSRLYAAGIPKHLENHVCAMLHGGPLQPAWQKTLLASPLWLYGQGFPRAAQGCSRPSTVPSASFPGCKAIGVFGHSAHTHITQVIGILKDCQDHIKLCYNFSSFMKVAYLNVFIFTVAVGINVIVFQEAQ